MLNNKEIKKYGAVILFFTLLLAGCGGEAPEGAHVEGTTLPSATTEKTARPAPTPTPIPTPTPTETPKGDIIEGWVSGIPGYVPRFGYGKIDVDKSKITEGSISTVFHLFIRDVEKADIDEYAIELKNAGYIIAAAELGNTYTLTASKDFGWNFVSLVLTLAEGDGMAVYTLDAPE